MTKLTFTLNPKPKEKYPKVADDGQVLTNISPYYVYTCINAKCGVCGWLELWVSKSNNHKCNVCGKIKARIANPKQIENEDFP